MAENLFSVTALIIEATAELTAVTVILLPTTLDTTATVADVAASNLPHDLDMLEEVAVTAVLPNPTVLETTDKLAVTAANLLRVIALNMLATAVLDTAMVLATRLDSDVTPDDATESTLAHERENAEVEPVVALLINPTIRDTTVELADTTENLLSVTARIIALTAEVLAETTMLFPTIRDTDEATLEATLNVLEHTRRIDATALVVAALMSETALSNVVVVAEVAARLSKTDLTIALTLAVVAATLTTRTTNFVKEAATLEATLSTFPTLRTIAEELDVVAAFTNPTDLTTAAEHERATENALGMERRATAVTLLATLKDLEMALFKVSEQEDATALTRPTDRAMSTVLAVDVLLVANVIVLMNLTTAGEVNAKLLSTLLTAVRLLPTVADTETRKTLMAV